MPAEQASHANVVASMFENLSKCLTDNAALLRELHARGLSGAMPGPSGAIPGPSAVVEAPSSTKKRKADEAPKPKQKRTLTAYQLFSAAEREAVKEALPELKSKEFMGEIGRRWKQLAPAAKKPFEDTAAQLKQENVATQEKLQAESGKPSKPKLPKKSLTSYQIWMAEERPKLKVGATASMGPQEAMAELGRRWKLLDAAGKKPYEDRAARLKQERQAGMDADSAAPSQPPELTVLSVEAVAVGVEEEGEKKKKKKKKKHKDKQPQA